MSTDFIGCHGRYRHYKNGQIYTIVTEAILEGADALMVVYRDIGTGKTYVRPHAEFYGQAPKDGTLVARFERVG